MPNELKPCPWCQNKNGKTDLQFSVIDDDFAQYVKTSMIKFCPFCGRSLKEGAKMPNRNKTDRGYLYIKAYSPYIKGVVGRDIKLTFKQKLQILFSKGISVGLGDVFKEEGADNG